MTEELDYMSDDFLAKCVDSNHDVRPSLLKSRKEQREHELMKKKQSAVENKKKPTEVLQAEVLEVSLKQPIESSNKGFTMLEKMGFKSGMGLGKNNSGIVEPIGVNIKNDKKGFGFKKPPKAKSTKINGSNLEKISETDYRAFLSKKNKERESLSDLRKSQKVCRELDIKCNKNEPEQLWFWPDDDVLESTNPEESEIVNDEEELKLNNEEKLESITDYLRKVYYYCIWCKIKYEDEKDLEDCPGPTREDH